MRPDRAESSREMRGHRRSTDDPPTIHRPVTSLPYRTDRGRITEKMPLIRRCSPQRSARCVGESVSARCAVRMLALGCREAARRSCDETERRSSMMEMTHSAGKEEPAAGFCWEETSAATGDSSLYWSSFTVQGLFVWSLKCQQIVKNVHPSMSQVPRARSDVRVSCFVDLLLTHNTHLGST